jgi:polyisoprenoid-binding protein YceI
MDRPGDEKQLTSTKIITVKKNLFVLLFILLCHFSNAQLFMTRTGFAGFYSQTSLETIKAENNQVYAVIDPAKKNLAFSLLMKGFVFERELMQEHFNENYAETDKFPKATFSGAYTENVDITKDATYNITVSGALTMHGVTKNIKVPATLEVKGGTLSGHAKFQVKPEDYNIRIPSVVRDKIAGVMDVTINISCNPVK